MSRLLVAVALLALGCASPHRDPVPKKDAASVMDAASSDTASTDTASSVTASSDTASPDTVSADTAKITDTATSADAAATVDSSSTADVAATDTQSPIDAGTAIDTTAVDASSGATIVCNVGKAPGPGDPISTVPAPSTSCKNAEKPDFSAFGLSDNNLPAPTLKVELGHLVDGAFTPYKEQQFVPLVYGVQGGMHVWLAFRITIPTLKTDTASVALHSFGLDACKQVATGPVTSFYPKAVAGEPGVYVYHSKLNPGLEVRIDGAKPNDVGKFCGKWLDLRLQVLRIGTKEWGQGNVLLRTWDDVSPNAP